MEKAKYCAIEHWHKVNEIELPEKYKRKVQKKERKSSTNTSKTTNITPTTTNIAPTTNALATTTNTSATTTTTVEVGIKRPAPDPDQNSFKSPTKKPNIDTNAMNQNKHNKQSPPHKSLVAKKIEAGLNGNSIAPTDKESNTLTPKEKGIMNAGNVPIIKYAFPYFPLPFVKIILSRKFVIIVICNIERVSEYNLALLHFFSLVYSCHGLHVCSLPCFC